MDIRPWSFANPANVLVILVDDMGWSDLGCYGPQLVPKSVAFFVKHLTGAKP